MINTKNQTSDSGHKRLRQLFIDCANIPKIDSEWIASVELTATVRIYKTRRIEKHAIVKGLQRERKL